MTEDSSNIRPGKEQVPPDIPDFDLIRPIGSGGFGQVWLATNRTTGSLRAVKVISLQQTGPADPAAREISSLSRLEATLRCRHPNLLHIHHVGKTASHLFYVMDPADDATGSPASQSPDYRPATLQSWLEGVEEEGAVAYCRNGPTNLQSVPDALHERCQSPIPSEICLDYARQLLSGLAALHAAGMVHRDVKPANCLFVGGQLKLADFGLLTEAHPLVSRLGTQKYMPPDGRMDMRADVYAAGLVIYEILSGLPVDQFPRLGSRAQQISTNPILAVLLRVVLRACDREPEQRFADARAMLAELDRPLRAAPHSPRRRLVAAACAAGLLAAAGWSAWALLPRSGNVSLVDVTFVTVPPEAKIYLDDTLLEVSKGTPYTTPCTVDGLPARSYNVAFECEGRARWDAGRHNLARTRQIVSQPP